MNKIQKRLLPIFIFVLTALFCLPVYAQSEQEAVKALRTAMRNRQAILNVTVDLNEDGDIHNVDDIKAVQSRMSKAAKRIYDRAMEHTGIPEEGDTLKFTIQKVRRGISYMDGDKNHLSLEIQYEMIYYDTKEMENASNNAIRAALRTIPGDTKIKKFRNIYNYIIENVFFDNAEGVSNTIINRNAYTSYGAIIEKKAVCNGYAILLYKMCLNSGIPCRIISGRANNENHVWNIVKINSRWYYCDVTWDYFYKVKGIKKYYLKAEMKDHTADEEYETLNFQQEYPIAYSDYNDVDYYNVTVVNGSGSGTYPKGKKITVKANKAIPGKKFVKWKGINSKKEKVQITVNKNINITAVYKYVPVTKLKKQYKIRLSNGKYLSEKNGKLITAKSGKKFTFIKKGNKYLIKIGKYYLKAGNKITLSKTGKTKWTIVKGHRLIYNDKAVTSNLSMETDKNSNNQKIKLSA